MLAQPMTAQTIVVSSPELVLRLSQKILNKNIFQNKILGILNMNLKFLLAHLCCLCLKF